MTAANRLLVLVLDAASPALLKEWAGDGTLPNIADLMAAGLVTDTQSVETLYVGSTWPSFYTGVNPGGHGYVWPERLELGTYRIRPCVPADFARRETVWECLSRTGHPVVVLDVPLCRLSPGLNGVQVVEWRSHDNPFGFQTAPRGLKRHIDRTVGDHPGPLNCDADHRSTSAYRTLADQLVGGAAQRAQLINRMLAEHPWEFAIAVFNESHCAGHQLWHFHDPAHPAYDHAVTRDSGDLIRQVYIGLDRAIGTIVAALDPGTTVVLQTLHGMSYMSGASLLLRDVLRRLGVLHVPVPASFPATDARHGVTDRLRSAYHRVPESIRRPLYDMRQRLRTATSAPGRQIAIDPARTKCFPIDVGPTVGAIRLNLRGREPHGTLTTGPEADQFCEQLARQLMELTDPGTGQLLARRVVRANELFNGAHLDDLPDLLVEWNLERPLGSTVAGSGAGAHISGYSQRVGLVEAVNRYCRTGDHRTGGLLIARGPGITPGRLGRVVSNYDLAPTFASRLGAEMTNTDGRVIPELLG